jgi:hypothetical protein
MLRFMPFTALLMHKPANDSRILPGGYALPSFETVIASWSQNSGALVRGEVDGQGKAGQSYEGGTST